MSDRERSTQLRRPPPLLRLLATLLFGSVVLATLSLVSVQMARHYSRDAARRAIRQVFDEGTETHGDVHYDVTCRVADAASSRRGECDPLVLKAQRSLRSVACRQEGFLDLFRNRWTCVASFHDGAALGMMVSVRLGRRSLELLLPLREPRSERPVPSGSE